MGAVINAFKSFSDLPDAPEDDAVQNPQRPLIGARNAPVVRYAAQRDFNRLRRASDILTGLHGREDDRSTVLYDYMRRGHR